MRNFLVIVFTILFTFLIVRGQIVIDSRRKIDVSDSCPLLFSKYTGSIDELLGNWHIAMAIMDEIEEVFQEQSICLEGKLLKINDTYLMQKWNIELAPPLYNDRGELEFPTSIIEPGLWLVQTPFGVKVRGTVLESDGKSYLAVVYCANDRKSSFHAVTLVMSRSRVVTSADRLKFLSILKEHGYDPLENKIIGWSNCS